MASKLKCVTWNVRGVRAKPKRNAALSILKNMQAEIIVLTETHLTGQLLSALKKPWVGWLYHAPYTSNSRGIALLVAKTVQFVLLTLKSDPQGRFLFLHAKINGLELLILAVYIPPRSTIMLYMKVLLLCHSFPLSR